MPFRVAILDDQLPVKLALASEKLDDIEVVWSGQSDDALMSVLTTLRPQVLVLQLEHLGQNPITRAQVLARLGEAELTIVTYAFARRDVIDALRDGAAHPVRAPLTVEDFRAHMTGLIMRSLGSERGTDGEAIRPARYSLDQLARLESMASSVQCECSHHLSTLLSSLRYFESYCQACESRHDQDAAIHHRLYERTARARMMLEDGLAETLEHEGFMV